MSSATVPPAKHKNGHVPALSLMDERSPLIVSSQLEDDESSNNNNNGQHHLNHARRLLYVSHTFAQFSECAWQFALILFLAAFSNYQSLILVSSYGLVAGLSVCLFGATAGRFVDGWPRLFVARVLIWTENVSVLVATALCYLLLAMHQVDDDNDDDEQEISIAGTKEAPDYSENWIQRKFQGVSLDSWSILLLVGIHIFGPLARILDSGFLVAIERDWVVVMAEAATVQEGGGEEEEESTIEEPNKEWLAETNVAMKQIDLSCRVLAPAVAGFVIGAFDESSSTSHHGNDLTGAALLVGIVNVAALIVEYICTARIYALVPSLAKKQVSFTNENGSGRKEAARIESSDLPIASQAKEPKCGMWKLPQGLSIYLQQPISPAGIGLAMLYLNALTFGALMTAYLVWRGMRLETVGIWRGISSAIGLLGTFVYHFSVRRITLVSTGMLAITYQFLCITLSFASLFVEDFNVSMCMLISGVCASRVGLWVFDISVTQLMQEFIPQGVRGVVGGTQQSLNSFFQLLSFGLGIIFPNPKEFHIYVAAGYSAVGIAMLLYLFCIFRRANDFLTTAER